MGMYIRKAIRVGPIRFNLSKSGVGISAGVKGLRIGTGPRGNYIHAGRHGLYYRQSLNTRNPETAADALQHPLLCLLVSVVVFFGVIAAVAIFFTNPFGFIELVAAAVVLGFIAFVVIAFSADEKREVSGPVRNMQKLIEEAKEVRRKCAQTFESVEKVALEAEYKHIYNLLMLYGDIPPSVLPPPVPTHAYIPLSSLPPPVPIHAYIPPSVFPPPVPLHSAAVHAMPKALTREVKRQALLEDAKEIRRQYSRTTNHATKGRLGVEYRKIDNALAELDSTAPWAPPPWAPEHTSRMAADNRE
jgi:hypothetical protein